MHMQFTRASQTYLNTSKKLDTKECRNFMERIKRGQKTCTWSQPTNKNQFCDAIHADNNDI